MVARQMYLKATFNEPLVGGHVDDPWTREFFDMTFAHGDDELAMELARAFRASGRFKTVTLSTLTESPVTF